MMYEDYSGTISKEDLKEFVKQVAKMPMEKVMLENGTEISIHNTEGLSKEKLTKQAEEAYKSGRFVMLTDGE